MALKGTTRIELTNVKTGQKEVYEKHNLVTNAVNDVLNMNPYGARFRNYSTIYFKEKYSNFMEAMLPICPNLFGGILLYEKTLEEDATQYYAPDDNPMVGYSSNDVSDGTDTKRGSMNQTESGPLEDGTGYRFVFDFATSQANGTIASLGLTSKWGGQGGYGSLEDIYSCQAVRIDSIMGTSYEGSTHTIEKVRARSVVSVDVEKNVAFYAFVSAANTIVIGKYKFPVGSLGLCDELTGRLSTADYSEATITTTTFATVLKSSNVFYGTLIDGGDGYIWGFQHEGNAEGNSADSATVLWVKINKEDWSFEEGTWTIDAQLMRFGSYHAVNESTSYGANGTNNAIIKDGVLYAIKYTSDSYMDGVYSIPLDNPTNVTLIESEDGSRRYYDNYDQYRLSYTNVNEVNNVILYRGFFISDGKLHPCNTTISSSKSRCLSGSAKPGLKYGPFIFGISLYDTSRPYVETFIQSCYLATINNLATPVEKTADKTMKITYILREE